MPVILIYFLPILISLSTSLFKALRYLPLPNISLLSKLLKCCEPRAVCIP